MKDAIMFPDQSCSGLDRSGVHGGAVPRSRVARCLGAALAALLLASCIDGDDDQPGRTWAAAWGAAPQAWSESLVLPGEGPPAPLVLRDQTVRQRVRVTLSGEAVRIRLSNAAGTVPITVNAATVARSAGGSSVEPGSVASLRFGGATSVTLPPGAERFSDPVKMHVAANAELAVSLYFAGSTPATTVHRLAGRTGYVAAGNASHAVALSSAAPMTHYLLVTGADVQAASPHRVVVAFGDGMTDGMGTTLDALRRYPDQLAARLQGGAAHLRRVAVVNAGLAGNRVLHDGIGPRAVARFERDVLGQSGVTHVIVLLGIDDIGYAAYSGPPHRLIPSDQVVSPDQIIAGYQSMIAAAQARHVKVILATLLPFRGAAYYSEGREMQRQAVNAWIRAQASSVHAIADFDRTMRDPDDPLALRRDYDSGDHLHPNDAGYAAMAESLDLMRLAD
jgi:lysophospholipase L1-like esterase